MHIALVVAVADNGVIGNNNALPWRLPDDLKRFKAVTMGKPIVMGRKTYDSIGRALPGRANIVISRTPGLQLDGCSVCGSLAGALTLGAEAPEVCVIGGAQIYAQALPSAKVIYLTRVHVALAGDVHFPELGEQQWREIFRAEHPADERHAYPFTFLTLERQR